jgi:7-cyano-7-deazaguanine synthase in queuosine biosynthesis
MKVDIIVSKPHKGKFSEIKLGYDFEDKKTEVGLNIDFKNLYMFTRKQSGIDFDLFLIGCFVYGIDILLLRERCAVNSWNREIEVEFPVENPDIFSKGKNILEETLTFLTGDEWKISFIQREKFPLYNPSKRLKIFGEAFLKSHKKVSLFSGGLDSLIGVIDQLATSNDRIALVSHYDGTSFRGARADQNKIIDVLKKKYSNYHLVQTRVDLSRLDTNSNKIDKETTLRARSFLFLCKAIFVAHSLDDNADVLIPENGTISLNYPLTHSRISSCSTRTSHPYYLAKLEEFIKSIGLNHSIKNRYELKTKGEMLEECTDRDLILKTYHLSCSCGKRGTRKDIRDNSSGTNHCGICMPCIYRRVALYKIGINELVGTDIFNPQKRQIDNIPDMPAFLNYMKQSLTIDEIKRNLLVYGTLPLDKLDEYANVVLRTRNEISKWISDKGSDGIKRKIGIKI